MAGLVNFEDEEEVKQFLDNLGVEYSFQCYKEKDPEGNNSRRCHHFTGAELRKTLLQIAVIHLIQNVCRVPKAGRLLGSSKERL